MVLTFWTPNQSTAASLVRIAEPQEAPTMQEAIDLWGKRVEWFYNEGNSLGFDEKHVPPQVPLNKHPDHNRSGLKSEHTNVNIPIPLNYMSASWKSDSTSSNIDLTGELHMVFETR
jgi:hypothetical protein